MSRSRVLLAVALTALSGCAGRSAFTTPPGQAIHVAVTASPSWPAAAVEPQTLNAARRFGECGLRLVFNDGARHEARYVLAFVDALTAADGTAIDGTSRPGDGLAKIAWADTFGTPLEHKQTAAHELGHVFGLRHAGLYEIDLMAPHGCELCRFTARQCAVVRATAVSG